MKALHVTALNALHGILIASLLWYTIFKKDLEGCGFVFNPHDPCVANKMAKGEQHTIRFHVDVLMCSHVQLTLKSTLYQVFEVVELLAWNLWRSQSHTW